MEGEGGGMFKHLNGLLSGLSLLFMLTPFISNYCCCQNHDNGL